MNGRSLVFSHRRRSLPKHAIRKLLAEAEQRELEEFKEACLLPRSEGVSYAVEKLEALQAEVKEQFREVFVELKDTLEVRKTLGSSAADSFHSVFIPLAAVPTSFRFRWQGWWWVVVVVVAMVVVGPPIQIVKMSVEVVLTLVVCYQFWLDLFIVASWRRVCAIMACWLRSQNKNNCYVCMHTRYVCMYRYTRHIERAYDNKITPSVLDFPVRNPPRLVCEHIPEGACRLASKTWDGNSHKTYTHTRLGWS